MPNISLNMVQLSLLLALLIVIEFSSHLVNTFRLPAAGIVAWKSLSTAGVSSTALYSKEVPKKRARYNVNRHNRGVIKKKFRGFPKSRKLFITIPDEDFMNIHRVLDPIVTFNDSSGTTSTPSQQCKFRKSRYVEAERMNAFEPQILPVPIDCAYFIKECTLVDLDQDIMRGRYRVKGDFPTFVMTQFVAEAQRELTKSKPLYPGGFSVGRYPSYALGEFKKARIVQTIINLILTVLGESGVAICDPKGQLIELSGETLKPMAASKREGAILESRMLIARGNETFSFQLDIMGRKIGQKIIYTTEGEGKDQELNQKPASSKETTAAEKVEDASVVSADIPRTALTMDSQKEDVDTNQLTIPEKVDSNDTSSIDANEDSSPIAQPKKRGRKPKVKDTDSDATVNTSDMTAVKPKARTKKRKIGDENASTTPHEETVDRSLEESRDQNQ